MTIRFLHAADIHLGFEQYGHKERYNDFARAFIHLADDAIQRKVDFVLLAGDLFHKRSIDPQTLFQAVSNLDRLHEAGIPVIGVEGNHERPHYTESYSWLDFLVDTDRLVLLSPVYENQQLLLDKWEDNAGAYIDLPGGIRIIGVKYYGASTPRVIDDLTRALADMPGPRPAYTILMLHAGLQGILDNYSATLTRAQLEPLRDYVDYMALGHIHKPFIQDDWIYNPGSLETNSMSEAEWPERGYFVVDVDPARQPAHIVEQVCCPRRAFERLYFPVDAYHQPEELYAAFQSFIQAEATPERVACEPVVEVRLAGVLAFDRAALDITRLEEQVQAAFHPLIVRMRDNCAASEFEIVPLMGKTDRAELEKHVLRELIERDIRHRPNSEQWAEMVLQIKRMALARSKPAEIVAELRNLLNTMSEEESHADYAPGTGEL